MVDVPSTELLCWVATAVGLPSSAVASSDMSQSGRGGPWLVDIGSGESTVKAVLKLGDSKDIGAVHRFATEAAAIELAALHGLRVPRLLASDLDGSVTDKLVILRTVLAGK